MSTPATPEEHLGYPPAADELPFDFEDVVPASKAANLPQRQEPVAHEDCDPPSQEEQEEIAWEQILAAMHEADDEGGCDHTPERRCSCFAPSTYWYDEDGFPHEIDPEDAPNAEPWPD